MGGEIEQTRGIGIKLKYVIGRDKLRKERAAPDRKKEKSKGRGFARLTGLGDRCQKR